MEARVVTGWTVGNVVLFTDLQENRSLYLGVEQGELAASTVDLPCFEGQRPRAGRFPANHCHVRVHKYFFRAGISGAGISGAGIHSTTCESALKGWSDPFRALHFLSKGAVT